MYLSLAYDFEYFLYNIGEWSILYKGGIRMYLFIKIVVILICISGLFYLIRMNIQYKNDSSTTREEILNYFKKYQATSLDTGIKIKDLPKDIAKNPYLLMMVQDKTLIFKKGRYYLNISK